MDSPIEYFKSGVQNLLGNEIIAQDAAQDALGFITQDGKLKLIGGRQLIGTDSGTTGMIRGLWFGYKPDGTKVLYRKTETTLDYFVNNDWTTIISGLTSGTEASFANYSSLAGSFTFFVTVDGFWKINNVFPANPMNMYNQNCNFHGRILINKGRTILWDRNDPQSRDRTTLYGSKIDSQTAPYYTAVSNQSQATGDGATKTYSGKLSPLPNLCNLFGLTVYAPTGPQLTVSAITNAANAAITTSTNHNLSVNDTVVFNGVKSGVPLAGTGTVSSSDNYNLVGVGTAFTTQLKIGARVFIKASQTDWVNNSGGGATSSTFPTTLTGIVAGITDDTHLTVQYPFNFVPNANTIITISGASFTYSSMSQLSNIACLVNNVIDATHFTIDVDSTNFDIYSSGDTVAKAEVLVDDRMGHLSALSGATGTINYITGAYTFNFKNNVANGQNVLATYLYENSNNGGLTDFTFSSTRVAGEGFILPQDQGGDPIEMVVIGQDGAYYSIKQQTAYRASIAEDDITVTNEVYYQNMGLPSPNSAVSTDKGIIFLNNSNPDKPEMTLLVRNIVSNTLEPKVLFPGFKFSLFDFSDSYFDTYERYVVVSCKVMGAAQNNRILLCNIEDGTVDISPYEARMFAKDDIADMYVGSSITQNVYQIWSGFDDLGDPINGYWIGAGDQYGSIKSRQARWRFIREELKKFRKYNVKGHISLDQKVQVWFSFDDAPFQLVGTIIGRGTYVDSGDGQAIGTNFIGQQQIGGDQLTNVYPYFCQLTLKKIPKFRKRTVKFVPTGIGYFDVDFVSDFDIMLFENRLPARYRSKQAVSLDGTETDQ